MKLYLIGYRCTGKTTIGQKLASHLNFEFVDTDLFVQKKTGLTITQIVDLQGWAKFRKLEKQALKETKKLDDAVISTGGGIVLDKENRQFIKDNGFCIWLTASEKIIIDRLNNDAITKGLRPPLSNLDILSETKELMQTRMPLYQQTHQLKIDTNVNTPDQCVTLIDRSLKNVRI